MRKTALISIIASFALAKSITLMPYGAYLNYGGDTQKNYGYVGGIYLSYYDVVPDYNSGFKWEFNAESDTIEYKDSTPQYSAKNFTLICNWYYGYNYVFKVGFGNSDVDNSGSDESGHIYITGVNYYKSYKYNVGVDYYRTFYKQASQTLNINQVSPYMGVNFGNYYSKLGSFYAKLKLNFIFSNKQLSTKKRYLNTDVSLSNYKGKFTTTLKASIGKNAYKIAKGGFVFYNTGDEYKYEYGLDVSYAINKTLSVKFSYSHSSFTDTANANSNSVMFSFIKGFY